ncbi:hypothetical protein BS17DRAFT_781270 [Gyrodon lividus]|nr:hypothetical protein BS17DRAFT_781270 [Gyrodon lividus]
MLEIALAALFGAGFTYEESMSLIQIITHGGSQAPLPLASASVPPIDGAASSEGASSTWAVSPGQVTGSVPAVAVPGGMHPNPLDANALPQDPPAVQATPDYAPAPAIMEALTCGLAGSAPCTQPLYGTMPSIRRHLRLHGHNHPERLVIQCPWTGCPDRLQWVNVPRHIGSIHLGIRLQCWKCGKLFTRANALERHVASNKC